jgi:hypothetical protein
MSVDSDRVVFAVGAGGDRLAVCASVGFGWGVSLCQAVVYSSRVRRACEYEGIEVQFPF